MLISGKSEIGNGDVSTPPVKRLCIFCYKVCSVRNNCHYYGYGNNYEDEPEGSALIKSFIKMLGRFLEDRHDQKKKRSLDCLIGDENLLDCCDECVIIVKSFVSVYHQVKCLEMQMEWKVESLVTIMKLANRVPSRIRQLNYLFEENNGERCGSDGIGEGGQAEEVETNGDDTDEKLESFKASRQNLIRRCTAKISKSQPRVLVKRSLEVEAGDVTQSAKTTKLLIIVKDEGIYEPEQDIIRDSLVENNENISPVYNKVEDCQYFDPMPPDEESTLKDQSFGIGLPFGKTKASSKNIFQNVVNSGGACHNTQETTVSARIPLRKYLPFAQFHSTTMSPIAHRIVRTKSKYYSAKTEEGKSFRCRFCNISYLSNRALRKHKSSKRHQFELKILKTRQHINTKGDDLTSEETSLLKINLCKKSVEHIVNNGKFSGGEEDDEEQEVMKGEAEYGINDGLETQESIINKDSITLSPQQYNLSENRKRSYLQTEEEQDREEASDPGHSINSDTCLDEDNSSSNDAESCSSSAKRIKGGDEKVVCHRRDASCADPAKIDARDNSGYYVCPLAHCAQTLNALKNLESHKKLHESFKCDACDVVNEFAPAFGPPRDRPCGKRRNLVTQYSIVPVVRPPTKLKTCTSSTS